MARTYSTEARDARVNRAEHELPLRREPSARLAARGGARHAGQLDGGAEAGVELARLGGDELPRCARYLAEHRLGRSHPCATQCFRQHGACTPSSGSLVVSGCRRLYTFSRFPPVCFRQHGASGDRAAMDLSLDATDKELVLDLLRTLRGTAAAAPAAPRAAANDRAGRAKEALADERAARKKAAANATLLKQEPGYIGLQPGYMELQPG